MSYKICRKPFEWMELFHTPAKSMYLCCPGWLPVSLGSFETSSLQQLWTGKKAKDIRSSVIDGSFKYCNSLCPYVENPNQADSPIEVVSEEEHKELQLATLYPELYLPSPKTINLAYDRSCNLRCPSCRTESIIAGEDENEDYKGIFKDVMSAYGNDHVSLYVTGGGDPFASSHYREVLESRIFDKSPNIKVRLHTNAIMLTESRWDKIRHIHNRIEFIEISMDGASKASYEHNRFPAKWETFKKRMAFISTIKAEYPAIKLKINFVLQSNNYHDLPLLLEYSDQWNIDIVKISQLDNWGTYTNEDYDAVAIHKQGHPQYSNLVEILSKPAFKDNDKVILDKQLADITKRIPTVEVHYDGA